MGVVFLDPEVGLRNQGFDLGGQYQMVPSGSARRMAFWMQPDEPEDVIIYCNDPNKLRLWGLYTIQGRAAVRGSGYWVARNSAIRFFMHGRDPGPTTITVESVSGKMRAFMTVSVKLRRTVTYQLNVLSDVRRAPDKAKAGEDMQKTMELVEPIFSDQSNIQLTRVGPINDVVVPADLGDPIVVDDPAILKRIADATIALNTVPADVYIYHTWDVVFSGNPNVGAAALGNMCFMEDYPPGTFASIVYAHEIGHALGLPHSSEPFHIMCGVPSFAPNRWFSMYDIETMNRM